MAEHLTTFRSDDNNDRAAICHFYSRTGACRQGARCSRIHNKPTKSRTLLLYNMYQPPGFDSSGSGTGSGQRHPPIDPLKIQDHYEDFYEDLFEELRGFGEIQALYVCHNLAHHLIGNVYVLFREEDHAASALQSLRGGSYCGRPIMADFCAVTDFSRATCRQFEDNICSRGAYYCNFMHVKLIARDLRKKLYGTRTPRPTNNLDRPCGGGAGGRDLGRPTLENHGARERQESKSPIHVWEGSEECGAMV